MQKGLTALMQASERGHVEVVKRLLEAGADVHAFNEVPAMQLNWFFLNSDPIAC